MKQVMALAALFLIASCQAPQPAQQPTAQQAGLMEGIATGKTRIIDLTHPLNPQNPYWPDPVTVHSDTNSLPRWRRMAFSPGVSRWLNIRARIWTLPTISPRDKFHSTRYLLKNSSRLLSSSMSVRRFREIRITF